MTFQRGNKLSKGRPPSGRAFSEMLRLAVLEKGADGKQKLRKLADILVDKALDGDIAALREIADRLEGKPSAVPLTESADNPIVINLTEFDLKIL